LRLYRSKPPKPTLDDDVLLQRIKEWEAGLEEIKEEINEGSEGDHQNPQIRD
jgi:hypothetical protein